MIRRIWMTILLAVLMAFPMYTPAEEPAGAQQAGEAVEKTENMDAAPQQGTHAVGDVLPIPSTSAEKWEDVSVQIVTPKPVLTGIEQSANMLVGEGGMTVTVHTSVPGTLSIQLLRYEDEKMIHEFEQPAQVGANRIRWDGTVGGDRVDSGEYALIILLHTEEGELSDPTYVFLEVDPQEESVAVETEGGASIPSLSPPYSTIRDGTFWAMTPGELDDEAIWEVLMQLITVYDDGVMHPSGHVYMMSNPDGTGQKVAQIHGKSQGVHVLDKEPNEYGYVLVEAFSNYDPFYNPTTDDEKAHAFELKRGYLLAKNLRTLNPEPDIGFVIDKLTQRMYMFRDGKRVSEFTVSTGKRSEEKYHRETIAGEFITIGHIAGYWSNDLFSDFPIRFNGGTLLHEVPHMVTEDGKKHYGIFERNLGTKHSSGCVRISYVPNEEGYNMEWLYNNLKKKGRYKIIVWDDINRYDTPTTWR